jgi:hypothetical protein
MVVTVFFVGYLLPNTPISLRVPRFCDSCGRNGLVRLRQTVQGAQILLNWHCSSCAHRWPVRRDEQDTAPSPT